MSEPTPRTPVVLSEMRIWRGIAMLILGTLLIGTVMVLLPFLTALAWAAVFSFTVWPLYARLLRWLGGRNTLSAIVFCLLVAAVVVVPLLVAVASVADDASGLAGVVRERAQTGLPPAPQWVSRTPVVGPRVSDWWDRLRSDLLSVSNPSQATSQPAEDAQVGGSRATLRSAVEWLQAVLIATSLVIGQGMVQLMLSLLFSFFILKDGQALATRLSLIASRVSAQRGVEILQVAGSTVRGVVYGILGTAVVQGVMAGVGLVIAGVPGASLLGALAFVLSPVPFGPGLVCAIPAMWLFSRGHTGMGVFLLIWAVIVSSIDNVIKPLLISRGSNMPFVLILIGVLGGAIAFGLIGVFIGPTLMAVAYKLIDAWSRSGSPDAGVGQ